MITKILGMIFIIFGTSFLGIRCCENLKTRYKNLEKITSCLVVLESELKFSKDFIDTLFKKVSIICDMPFLFKTCSEIPNDIPIKKRWQMAIEKDKKDLKLSENDAEILLLLGSELGMSDTDTQISNIQLVLSLLKKATDNAHYNLKTLSKLYSGLGVLSGIFISLILL